MEVTNFTERVDELINMVLRRMPTEHRMPFLKALDIGIAMRMGKIVELERDLDGLYKMLWDFKSPKPEEPAQQIESTPEDTVKPVDTPPTKTEVKESDACLL